MATTHTGIRAYAFQCTYDSQDWVDNPVTLIDEVKLALSDISNFSYSRVIISSIRNSSRKETEIEIDGIIYQTKTKLNATENDDLITDIEGVLDTITDLTYDHVNIVNDIFREDPTTGWPG